MVYENDAERRDLGVVEESFARRYLWSRAPPIVDVPEERGHVSRGSGGDGRGTGGRDEATQFEIGSDDEEADEDEDVPATGKVSAVVEDEEDDDENEIDAGVRAFKATIGNPPSPPATTNGQVDGSSKREEATNDPLTQPAAKRSSDDEGPEEEQGGPCLVDRLFSCTIDLLFCAGFTVPDSVRGSDKSGEKINVSDISPLRAFIGLRPACLLCRGTRRGEG